MRALNIAGAVSVIVTIWVWGVVVIGDFAIAGTAGLALISHAAIAVLVAGSATCSIYRDRIK